MSFLVIDPKGVLMVEPFENVIDALVYMRHFGKAGARVMQGKVVLAVKVAAAGPRATLKGALGRRWVRAQRAGATDTELEDESGLEEGES